MLRSVLGGPAGHGRAGADDLELVAGALVTQPADQHGYVGALPAAVGVQLVESEELEALGGADQVLALVGPGEDKLEHHVVRQQDVGWLGQDPHALVARLLARVAGVGDGLPAARVAEGQELLQLADLRVRQGVHRVDDDRLDARASLSSSCVAIAENGVDDGHDVGQRLAGAGAGGQHVALAGPGYLDRLTLVLVKHDRVPAGVLQVVLAPEDPRRLSGAATPPPRGQGRRRRRRRTGSGSARGRATARPARTGASTNCLMRSLRTSTKPDVKAR